MFWTIDGTIQVLVRAAFVKAALHFWGVAAVTQAMIGVTVSCSWARHFTLTVMALSTQENKWVLANCWDNIPK